MLQALFVSSTVVNVRFGMATYSVNERSIRRQRNVVVNLILSNPSSKAITLSVQGTDDTATGMNTAYHVHNVYLIYTGGGIDYDSGPYTVSFPAGMTSISFDVPITDDNILENNEQFHLIFSNTLPDHVTIGNPSQTIVTITDNDSKISVLISFFVAL